MRKRNRSQEPGLIRTLTWLAVIAVIAVKTIRALLMAAVRTYEGIASSRQSNRA
jgi:hypothetical protein